MSKTKLNDFKELIIKNPELPIKFFTNEDCYSGNFQYEECFISSVNIDEIALYGDKWLDKEDLYEQLEWDLYTEGMSEDELEINIDNIMSTTKFEKAICIFFG